jgi:hypothetical protein
MVEEYKIDILAVTESWLTCDVDDGLVAIDGYDFI